MNRTKQKKGFTVAAILLILLLALFGCDDGSGGGKGSNDGNTDGEDGPPPVGISGFPTTLTMGEPFDLRKGIKINLPDAPDKTFDDITWGQNNSGTAFAADKIVIGEDDMFIPITFFHDPTNGNVVTVHAIVTDGEGEGFDYATTFQTTILFPLNPFIGSWSGSDGKTWTFNTDGTYDIGSETNYGSFAVWSGRPGRKFLITVSGDPDTITVERVTDGTNGKYTPYLFELSGNTIKITPIEFDYTAYNKIDAQDFEEIGAAITLTRASGAPAALDLSVNDDMSMMIGTFNGGFAASPFTTSINVTDKTLGVSGGPRPYTYYADGRNHSAQYEGVWLKRGAVFATVGNDGRRWDPPALASWDTVTATQEAIKDEEIVCIHEYRTGVAGTPYSRGSNTTLFWRLIRIDE